MKDRANKIVRTRQQDVKRQVKDYNAFMKTLRLPRHVETEILKFGIRKEYQSPLAAAKFYLIEVYIPELLKKLMIV